MEGGLYVDCRWGGSSGIVGWWCSLFLSYDGWERIALESSYLHRIFVGRILRSALHKGPPSARSYNPLKYSTNNPTILTRHHNIKQDHTIVQRSYNTINLRWGGKERGRDTTTTILTSHTISKTINNRINHPRLQEYNHTTLTTTKDTTIQSYKT